MVGFREVKAIESGQVKVIGTPSGWLAGGTQVWIQHDGYFSRSLHLASYSVRSGQFVRAGETIGIMGTTPHVDLHLHLEISPGNVHYSNTGQVDPVAFISARIGGSPAGGGSTPEDDMPTMSEFLNYPAYDGGPTISTFFKNVDQGGIATQVWFNTKVRRPEGDFEALQELADTKTILLQMRASQAGLEEAIKALANSRGLDAGEILNAAQAGVENALRNVSFTAEIAENTPTGD